MSTNTLSKSFLSARSAALGAVLAGFAAPLALAQDFTVISPSVDRWMYPFGSQAGSRPTVPTFASLNTCGTDDRFDDRDAQFLIIFDISAIIPAGQPPSSYSVSALRLTARVDTDVNFGTPFIYDDSYDLVASYFATGDAAAGCSADPARIPDADQGRPIELFAVAFRNGFTASTYLETSPFKPGNAFSPPWTNVRNAYSISFDAAGAPVDVQNNVKNRAEVTPLAMGLTASVAPGNTPPDGAEFVFDLDLTLPGVLAYVQQSLASGRLALLVTSMAFAEQQSVGSYPTWYTKEADARSFPNAAAPALHITLSSANPCPADFNHDGVLNADDLGDFITGYFNVPSDPATDFNADGVINADDLGDFITAYFNGC